MMMEQITLEQFRRTVRIRLRLLRVFILLCAAAVFCAHFWGHRGGVPGARFPYYVDLLTGALSALGISAAFICIRLTKMLRDDVLLHKMYTKATDEREALLAEGRTAGVLGRCARARACGAGRGLLERHGMHDAAGRGFVHGRHHQGASVLLYAKILKGASGMNGIEDRVTSLLTWGLPLGALAFCASLVLAWFGAPDGFWRGFWEGAAAVLVVAGLAARLWRSFRTRGK